MNFLSDLEKTFFYFGFRECKNDKRLNFLRLVNNDYLLMRISVYNNGTADLSHAKFGAGCTPCNSEPYWTETLKNNFYPDTDNSIISNFIKNYIK